MDYNDTIGTLLIDGDARAVVTRLLETGTGAGGGSLIRIDAMSADMADVRLEPGEGFGSEAGTATQEREVIAAVLVGTAERPAEVTRRTLRPGAGDQHGGPEGAGGEAGPQVTGREVEAFQLRGAEIRLDGIERRVDVPTPGLMFFEDHRPRGAERQGPPRGDGPLDRFADGGGSTLVEWRGWMVLREAEGVMELRGQGSIFHRQGADGSETLLEAEEIDATFDNLNADGGGGGGGAEAGAGAGDGVSLRTAEARGTVYIRGRGREVLADRAQYDAASGRAVAEGQNGRPVVLIDTATGQRQEAERVEWDLVTDVIRITRPGAVAAPRG